MRQGIDDKDGVVKISCCGNCEGIVRASVVHTMTTKSKNEFLKEVMKYNLSVKEMPLLKYRSDKPEWCDCR